MEWYQRPCVWYHSYHSILAISMSPSSTMKVPPATCGVYSHLPVIETAVDDRVVHGGAHGQPQDSQVDLLDVAPLKQLHGVRVELLEQEVDVVRQPAHCKRTHHHDHHLHDLERRRGRLKAI